MPEFRVAAREKFIVQTVYHVQAETPDEAVRLCQGRHVAFHQSETQKRDEEWLEMLSVEPAD
jgi:hypothetical protein